jgi:hypothetical protein
VGKICLSCCSQHREARRRAARERRTEDLILRRIERRWARAEKVEGLELEPMVTGGASGRRVGAVPPADTQSDRGPD